MGTFFFRTETVSIAATPTTFTHGLGVAPAGAAGAVFITMKTSTGVVYVNASSSQIIVLQSTVAGVAIDLVVMAIHSIIS